MSIKVVINTCYGGFTISKACAELMASLGSDDAKKLLEAHLDLEWYGYLGFDYSRHCKFLVRAVEELGDRSAAGSCSKLAVITLKGNKYIIQEYDGLESVVEPEDIGWITV